MSVVESSCPGVIKVEDLEGEHGRLIMEVGPLRSFYVPVSPRTAISTVGTMAIIATWGLLHERTKAARDQVSKAAPY